MVDESGVHWPGIVPWAQQSGYSCHPKRGMYRSSPYVGVLKKGREVVFTCTHAHVTTEYAVNCAYAELRIIYAREQSRPTPGDADGTDAPF